MKKIFSHCPCGVISNIWKQRVCRWPETSANANRVNIGEVNCGHAQMLLAPAQGSSRRAFCRRRHRSVLAPPERQGNGGVGSALGTTAGARQVCVQPPSGVAVGR